MAALRLVCLAVVLAVGLVQALDISKFKDVPVLARTFKNLSRGPPQQVVTNRAVVQEKWITQKLDNFDESNTGTYQMVGRLLEKKAVPGKELHNCVENTKYDKTYSKVNLNLHFSALFAQR